MTWIRIDDQFAMHPKVAAAGGDAGWLHICALCYCGEYLTDGVVPKSIVARLSDRKNPLRLAKRLVDAGMWIDEGEAYRIHNYLEYQEAADTIRQRKTDLSEKRSAAGRKGAQNRWQPDSNTMANGMANEWQPPSQPDGPIPIPIPNTGNCEEHPSLATGDGLGKVIDQAARLMARQETERRVAKGELDNPGGYLRSRLPAIRRQHTDAWRRVLEAEPGTTAEQLVAHVTAPPDRTQPALTVVRPPDWTLRIVPDALDMATGAQRARELRAARHPVPS